MLVPVSAATQGPLANMIPSADKIDTKPFPSRGASWDRAQFDAAEG